MSRLPTNSLPRGSASFWLLDGDLVREDDFAFFAQQLGASEARRYGRFSRRERQRQFLLGRVLLRFAISDLTGFPPNAIGVVERPDIAPRLILPEPERLPNFSLSHSRNWIACVVSADAMVGVDIEVNDPSRDLVASSQLAFQPNDYLWFLRQSDAVRVSAFYQMWSTREALFKLESGLGRESAFGPLVGVDGKITSQGCGWYGYPLSHSDCTLLVCSDQPLLELRKIELTGFCRADWLRRDHPSGTDQADCFKKLHSWRARTVLADKTVDSRST